MDSLAGLQPGDHVHDVSRVEQPVEQQQAPGERPPPPEGGVQDQAGPQRHQVSRSPIVTGNDDWNTMAPVRFPRASVSFPRRTQITLLNFSGSSVASGASRSANASRGTPRRSARTS